MEVKVNKLDRSHNNAERGIHVARLPVCTAPDALWVHMGALRARFKTQGKAVLGGLGHVVLPRSLCWTIGLPYTCGVKSNALPEQAWALVNHRISVSSNIDELKTRDTKLFERLARKFNLTMLELPKHFVGWDFLHLHNLPSCWNSQRTLHFNLHNLAEVLRSIELKKKKI